MQMHDIFPAVDTTWYLAGILSAGLLIVLVICYFLWRWIKGKKKKNRTYYLGILQQCNLDDTKTTANQLCYYSKYLVRTPEQKEMFHTLCTKLSPYKYTKEPLQFSISMKQNIEAFLKEAGAKHV
jgi:hypothetical protein